MKHIFHTSFNMTSLEFSDELPNVAVLGGNASVVEALGFHPIHIRAEQIPPTYWKDIYDLLDLLLLWGGDDLPPQWTGGASATSPSPRDMMEFQMVVWAWNDQKPMLGICRGMQLLNVVLGGTLIQDIHDSYPKTKYPRLNNHTGDDHEIIMLPGSKAYYALGSRLMVNSLHHQAVDRIPPELMVTARASDGLEVDKPINGDGDGLVEVIEAIDRPNIIGVQFHPEFMSLDILHALIPSFIKQRKTKHIVR
jgi:putative glutamine amidotransferase